MAESSDKYVRVYYSIRGDERTKALYLDDHHLATWLRLLLDADAAWPAPASLPRSASHASVVELQAAGVLELLPGHLFRFHGLDAERARRSHRAADAAASRWAGANASAQNMPRRAETSKDKTSTAGRMNGIDHEDLSQEHAYGKHRIVQDLDCPLCYNQPQP